MSKSEIELELAELRAALSTLQSEREGNGEAATLQDTKADNSSAGKKAQPLGETSAANENLQSQLEELTQLLQLELRELPAISCLAVFSLGILVGRLMRNP